MKLDIGAHKSPIKLVEIETPRSEDVDRLATLGLDLTEHGEDGHREAVVYSAAEERLLRAAGFDFKVTTPDLAAASRADRRADRAYAASVQASPLPSGRDQYRRLADFQPRSLSCVTVDRVLRGRCACRAVAFEVADEFVAAFNCHCSNCRATTGSAFLPWGEIERDGLRVTEGADAVMVRDATVRCGACLSLLYWSPSPDGERVRVPYGALVDEPSLKPAAHMFVGSKAPWHEILDDLPRHDDYPDR